MLTRYEQETIILYNEDEATAVVQTYNRKTLRYLNSMLDKHDGRVQLESTDVYGGKTYRIPKNWIRIRAPRQMTNEQKEAARERMLKMHESKK